MYGLCSVPDPNSGTENKVNQIIVKGVWPIFIINKLRINRIATTHICKLKDHKIDLPISPFVTKCSGPTYFMEKKNYVHLLKLYLPQSDFVIESNFLFYL